MSLLLLFGGGGASAKALITWAEIECTDAVVPTVAPITGGAGWVTRTGVKKKKRKRLEDELDELILHARERIVETAEIEDPILEKRRAELRVATNQALIQANRDTQVEISYRIGQLRRIIEEIDDEEVLLLMS